MLSASNTLSRGPSEALFMMPLVIFREMEGSAAISWAKASVPASSSSAGNTWLANPRRRQSAPLMRAPVNRISFARWGPTMAGRVAMMPISGARPILQKLGMILASSAAHTRSQASIMLTAPPTA